MNENATRFCRPRRRGLWLVFSLFLYIFVSLSLSVFLSLTHIHITTGTEQEAYNYPASHFSSFVLFPFAFFSAPRLTAFLFRHHRQQKTAAGNERPGNVIIRMYVTSKKNEGINYAECYIFENYLLTLLVARRKTRYEIIGNRITAYSILNLQA